MAMRRVLGVALAVFGLVIAQRLLNPAPMPAAGVLLGGLIPLALGWNRRALAVGTWLGCALGAVVHGYSHISEGRAEAPLELAGHVLADAGLGTLVGGLLLLVAMVVSGFHFTRAEAPPVT